MLPSARSRRGRLQLLPALLSGMMLTACSTTPTTAPVALVPCDAVPIISFSAPALAEFPDPSNIYDSSQTVAQIRRNKAAWRAVCQPSN